MSSLIQAVDSLARLFAGIRGSMGSIVVSRVERSLDEYVEATGVSRALESPGIVGLWEGGRGFDGVVGYVDSSSRSIGFSQSRFTITGLAVSVNGLIEFSPNVSGVLATRFLGVKSVRPVLERVESSGLGFTVVKSVVGEYYDVDYKDDNIGDELRIELENRALEKLGGMGSVDVVVVDGPVYHAQQILFHDNWRENKYARAFYELLKDRVKVLANSGKPVVGFVKRVEYSRKLAKCDEVVEIIEKAMGRRPSPETTDPLIVEYLAETYVKPRLMQLVVIGPLLLEYKRKPRGLEELLVEKVYWYIARKTPRGYQIARIEVLRKHWDRWKNTILEALDLLLSSLSLRGVPVGLEIVDRASRRLTALLYMLLYQRLAGIISLAYDEYGKVNEVYRELVE